MPTVARSIAARRSCHRNDSHLKRWRRWAVVLLLVTGSACSYAPPQPAGFSTRTVDASPSGSPSPTDTALPAPPAPTPVAAWQLSVEDAASLAELQTLLVGVTLEALDTARGSFDQANPECLLLVPEGSDSQRSLLLVDGEGRSFAAANLNVPLMAVRDAPQPRFNEKDSALVMRWEDASGHRFYHCPLREDQTGRPLAVYQRNNELYEAFVGADGRIEAKSERPFWQAVPSEAKNIALVKFDRAVYLTFWRADGQQIEPARIKVSSLPEAIPTPEPKEAILKVGAVNLINQSTRCEMRYRNEDSREKVRQFMEIAWAKKLGITPAELRQRLAKGEKVTDVVVYPIILPDGSNKFVSGTVDLSKEVDYVSWDNPEGFGRTITTRLNYDVTDGKLTIYAYFNDRMIDQYPYPSCGLYPGVGLIQAMVIVLNYGRVVLEDPIKAFPEAKDFLFVSSGDEYISEIGGYKR